MDFIKRKVFLTRNLAPTDTNGDGTFNALVLSATTKTILVPLTHTYDDMGVFEVSDEDNFEIIDVGSIFDTSIGDITQPPNPISGETINWGSGTSNGGTIEINGDIISYCSDQTANNYLILTATTTSDGLTLYNPLSNPPVLSVYPHPKPTFQGGTSLCTYDEPIYDGSGDGTFEDPFSEMICLVSSEGHPDPNHINTTSQPRTGTCNHSWFNLTPWNVTDSWFTYRLAINGDVDTKALAECQSQGYTSLLNTSDFGTTPQGDPNDNNGNPTQPWAGVKLKDHVDGQCNGNSNIDPYIPFQGNLYRFCFWCKK